MKKIIFGFFFFALALACVRILTGAEPFRFRSLLELIENVDLNFTDVLSGWHSILDSFREIRQAIADMNVWNAVSNSLRLINRVILLPINVVIDLVVFIQRVLALVFVLIAI